ncbi:SDR family NAD(P)-dependent oxidoreductase [Streptomyces sp. NPDC127084]|uniref:SDR family NAD(P)-dependent oxidoreductase n=1 Tax=Streptomyces sp. NPDC127084 TaxID=3347133 RepID=UPI003664455F
MRITGSTVLLTGVTGGIGAALASELGARGARLILTGRRPEALEPLVERYGARGVVADLADPDDIERLAREAAGADILVANAALPSSGELLDYTPEQLDRALAVNLRAPAMLARLLAPAMVEARRGHLAFVGSMSGKTATKHSALYNATKFGLRGFALGLRQDLHEHGVGVSVIQPGFVRDAGMFAATGAEAPAGLGTVSPRQVVAGVVRAIEQDRAEVNVAPAMMKVLTAIGGQFPGFSERVQRRAGESTDRTLRRVVEAQRKSR